MLFLKHDNKEMTAFTFIYRLFWKIKTKSRHGAVGGMSDFQTVNDEFYLHQRLLLICWLSKKLIATYWLVPGMSSSLVW